LEEIMARFAAAAAAAQEQQQHCRPGRRNKAEHLGKHRQYWTTIILAVNDGLVSTFLLVAGVVGGGLGRTDVLLAAISSGIAGAVSMAAGQFLATKSQEQVLKGEIALESSHIRDYHSDEIDELRDLLAKIGLEDDEESGLVNEVINHYEHNDGALLKLNAALEFGVIEEERRSPVAAAVISFFLFIAGALPSIIPFAFVSTTFAGLVASAVATGVGLMLVGCAKAWATRGKWYKEAMENLFVAAGGGGLAYGIGVAFEKVME
jgi:VIT1/CCC1 family predicted Fe2+/Mn2+ transporter